MRTLGIGISILVLALSLTISRSALAQTATQQQSAPSQAPPPSAQPNAPGSANQSSAPAQTNEDNPLNLTEDQKTKLRPIIMEENQQIEAVRNDTTMTQDQKIAKANQIRADASPKIKAILTPEQLQKLAELQRERAQQQQGGPSASPSNSPGQPSNSQPPNSQPGPNSSQPPQK